MQGKTPVCLQCRTVRTGTVAKTATSSSVSSRSCWRRSGLRRSSMGYLPTTSKSKAQRSWANLQGKVWKTPLSEPVPWGTGWGVFHGVTKLLTTLHAHDWRWWLSERPAPTLVFLVSQSDTGRVGAGVAGQPISASTWALQSIPLRTRFEPRFEFAVLLFIGSPPSVRRLPVSDSSRGASRRGGTCPPGWSRGLG